MNAALAMSCTLLTLGTTLAAPPAEARSITYNLDMPAQNLGSALQELALVSRHKLLYKSQLVEGKTAPALKGEFTTEEAVAQLLAGTKLTYDITPSEVVLIREQGDRPLEQANGEGSNRGADNAEGAQKNSFWDRFRLAQTSQGGVASSASVEKGNGEQVSQPPARLEEVVVTANKRQERLQDVPVSITALGGSQLERTEPKSLLDLNGYVPGLTVTSGGTPGETQLTLRGISTGTSTFGSLVGTYIDEVPVGSSSAQIRGSLYSPDLMPYDLERIEVLSGPQGTLYGAASMGGLFKYVLKDPQLDELFGRAGGVVDYIDRSGRPGGGARATVNIPVVKGAFGLRLSGYDQKTQGYIHNVGFNDAHYNPYTQQGGRLAGLWRVTDALSIKFSAMFQNIKSNGNSAVTVDPNTRQPLYGSFASSTALQEQFTQHAQLYSLSANWNLGFASLVSASGWQHVSTHQVAEGTPTYRPYVTLFTNGAYTDSIVPFPSDRTLQKFTQELRLASASAQQYEWMLGAFYTHESTVNFQPIYALDASGQEIPGINPFFSSRIPWSYDEFAGFANGTFHFNEHFAFAGGVRYSKNHQSNSAVTYGELLHSTKPLPPDYFTSDQGVLTWMAGPQWHINEESMLYGRVATGYRPGGWSFADPPAPASFKADTLKNYEIGLKATLSDTGLVVDMAIYDIEWKDIQENVVDPNTKLVYLGNGGHARSRGVEAAISYSVHRGLQLGATLGYTDARLTEDAPGLSGLSGDRLPLSGKFTGALTADYHQLIGQLMGSDTELQAGAAFRFSSSVWTQVVHNPQAVLHSQPKPLDLYGGLRIDRVEVRLFIRNVFNSEPSLEFVRTPTPAEWPTNSLNYISIAPRTVGLSVDVNF